jgi:FtsH-binding integral membrane protein
VVIFGGLTAYDIQKIKLFYMRSNDPAEVQRLAIIGALQLYIDFINIFLALLRLMNQRR